MSELDPTTLPSVTARLAYLGEYQVCPHYSIYPPSSGRETESPPKEHYDVRIYDCRPALDRLTLDRDGFLVRGHTPASDSLYDEDFIRGTYYPEIEKFLKELTGAEAVLVFDHNLRSASSDRQTRRGVQAPVDGAHCDYSATSGPRRAQELLEAHGQSQLSDHRVALMNVWRPLTEPVQDRPLAVCHPGSVATDDFVETDIDHYGEDDLSRPRHSGQIYSLRYNPQHRWFYASDMRSDEMLVFKTYDSLTDGTARFTAHTAFAHPHCPVEFVPRESIEVRTVVAY